MSGDILFLAHRIPFPPDRGDKIRSHHILKAIAGLARVHVGCLSESRQDAAHEPALGEIAASYWMPPRTKPLAVAGLEAVLRGKSVSITAFHDSSLARWVEQVIAAHEIETIYVFSGQMGQYIPPDFKGRVVLDLVDVDSAKFEAYARQCSGVKKWLYEREARLLANLERALVKRADATLLVSTAEADLLRERVGKVGVISALGNGIDCKVFSPECAAQEASPYPGAGPHFVFTGQMDYPPNCDAVIRFATKILPAIRAACPSAQFHIVGRAPLPEVKRLADLALVSVHGEVPDMRRYLAHADQVVVPLTIARGVQNKVLEAMAMARAVLLSPEAATGIAARHGEHFVICETDAAFVEAALSLIDWPEDLATLEKQARECVCTTMSWPAALAPLPALIGLVREEGQLRIGEQRNAA